MHCLSDGICGGVLLLDTALQIPVHRAEDVIKLEIPLAEALQLMKALTTVELTGSEHLEDVVKELDRGIEAARHDTEGSHKTAKWATVCLQLRHAALKSVCTSLVSEMKRTSQQGPALPVAAAISDRLSHLLPSSIIEAGPGPIDRSLMYSEAARRQTFSKWPHMGYKWALPEPMAQAGFYHQPNSPGDDRAMCFTCNVCLVCWEPTDEPWSEHERHSPQCPYIKGEFTQNVPLSVTYATHPAQLHGEVQDKIACISTTFNEDFVATSTRDGNIVVWNISHLLQKHCTFNLDLADAVVALKTGLQIERSRQKVKGHNKESANTDQEIGVSEGQKGQLQSSDNKDDQDAVQEILLHNDVDDEVEEEGNRPSNDLVVSSLCIIDWSCRKDVDSLVSAACLSSKGAGPGDVTHPSLVCGVSLLRTKCANIDGGNSGATTQLASSLDRRSEVVQLMNRVNEGVRNEDLRIITDPTSGGGEEEFVLPESTLIPHLLVVSFDRDTSRSSQRQGKGKEGGSGGDSSKGKGISPGGEGGKAVQMNSVMPNDTWSMLLESDPWLDPDVQIVGFTPSPVMPSPLKDGQSSNVSKPVPILQNGPSDLSGSFGGMSDSALKAPVRSHRECTCTLTFCPR
nr:hypothetical protein BaRGS_012271 [Batillaria attramentaria]